MRLGLAAAFLTGVFLAVFLRHMRRRDAQFGQPVGNFEVVPALIVELEYLVDDRRLLRHGNEILHLADDIAVGAAQIHLDQPAAVAAEETRQILGDEDVFLWPTSSRRMT